MSINASSPFMFVGPSSNSYVSNNGPAAGMVRFNTNTQCFEAFDGSIWIRVAHDQSVGLTSEAVEAIQWARDKIIKEQKLKYPIIKEHFKKIQIYY